MSTNKSERYQLNLWEPGDDFIRTEFNENFEKLDGAARVVFGTYTGDGAATRHIELGFQPAGIILMREDGIMAPSATSIYGGLAFQNRPAHSIRWGNKDLFSVDESGFTVHYQLFEHLTITVNTLDYVYFYMAIR